MLSNRYAIKQRCSNTYYHRFGYVGKAAENKIQNNFYESYTGKIKK